MNQAYQVKLDAFEGPLDLLLHLIKQYEIDIYDIPMAQLTGQYMNYIHTMQQLELNIASEYLVVASELLAIKSQMLLPKPEAPDDDEEYMEDPREELMERLIEYRKYKEAAGKLKEKETEANHIFTRPPVVFDGLNTEKKPVERGDMSIYDMLGALGKMLERKKWKEPLDTKIKRAEIPIEQRMADILQLTKNAEDGVVFSGLFPQNVREHIVVTFIALLELMKNNQVYCRQKQHFDELVVYSMGE